MTTPTAAKPADPLALLRTLRYLALALAAILGVPIAAFAYFFLKLVAVLQKAIFTQLPSGLGFHGEPLWWPLVIVAVVVAYVVVARIDPPPGQAASQSAPAPMPREATRAPGAAPPAGA